MEQPDPQLSWGTKKILIVDDENIVRGTLEAIFKRKGYQTRTAESAEGALALITDWIPDVSIIDIGLPGLNGIQLARLVRRRHPECQILLFSGRTESAGLLNEMKAESAFETVAKPVHPEFLLDWVKKRFERWT